MEIFNEILGNIHQPEWRDKLKNATVEYIDLDQWIAQKSRFVARSDSGNEYAVALTRHAQLADGDILRYTADANRVIVVRLILNDVMVIDMSALERKEFQTVAATAVELGHAIGNQHWPAVVKGVRVYVPLTVDKKVMLSVMNTHHIEGITYSFQPGSEIIPYLAPHEVRRLFGGAEHASEHIHDAHTHHH